MWLLTLQLLKNSIGTQEKLRLNFYSLSVSASEFLEYGRSTCILNLERNLYTVMFDLKSVRLSKPSW
jgi:hypothetical protein